MTETLESYILTAQCPKCKHEWQPYGDNQMMVPCTRTITCPSCSNTFERSWYDQETMKRLEQETRLVT